MSPQTTRSKPRPAWARYGVAVGSVILGWLAREALTPVVGQTALPFIFFFPAVAIAAWYGGCWPGVLAAVLSTAAAAWFFIEPIHTFAVGTLSDVAALAAFLISSGFIIGAMEAMHRARARAVAELAERQRVEAELAGVREMFSRTLGNIGNITRPASAYGSGPFLKVDSRATKPAGRLIRFMFLAAAVLIVATTIFVYRVGLIRIRAQQKMSSQLLVLQQLEDFLSSLKDAETGQRGYLLTGDEPYLQPYTNLHAQVRAKLDGLQRLVLSGELPRENVERIAALTEQKLSELEQTIQLRRDRGLDAALAVVRGNEGKHVMDQIRTEIGQMRANEEKEFDASSLRANWAARLRGAAFIGACFLNLMFLAGAFRRISTEVRIRETAVVEAGQQRELLATTLASIGDAVIATDANGGVVFLNPTAETLTGWKNSEAAGKLLPGVFHILNEQTRQPVENPVEKVLRLGTVIGLANHSVLLAKDGREIPIDDSAAPIRQPDGQILGVVLVFRDATLQRKAHGESARLAAIVEHSGDAIFTKNLDGIVQTWNASAQRLFGYRAEEIVGQHVTLLFPPDRLNEEDDILGRLREGRPIERLETIRVAKDGKRIPVSVSVSPLRDKDGKIIGASKIIHDVTDLVAAREALLREKELLATTLASIGDAVIVTNAEGRITFLNTEAERLTKWKNAEASGQQLPKVFTIINEQSRATVEDPVEKVLRLGVVVGLANHTTLIAKDGTEIPIDDSAAPIRQADGPLFGVVLVFRDVREQRKAQAVLLAREEALRQAHAQLANHATELESLVQQRTARLNEMIGDLEAFSYSIVHDLRGPLRAMQGFAQLLADEYGPIGGTARNYVGRIQTAAERMDRLIQDGLSYSRIMRGDLALVPVDVAALVRGIVHTYPAFQPPHAEIELQENIPYVNGNESALTQCVSNLLGNAVKFVAPGVIPRVRIWAETRDGRVRLFFKDNGIGIEMEAHEKIFRIFERLDRAYEGTGIGLAIVKKAAERMGGSVGIESAPGQGSTFWLDLAGTDHGPRSTEQARTTRGHL